MGDTVLVIWSRRQGRDGGWVRNPTVRTHSPAEDKSRRVFYWKIFCSSIQDTMKSSMLTLSKSPWLAPDTLLAVPSYFIEAAAGPIFTPAENVE